MTAVAGLEVPGRGVWIAGDSAGTDGSWIVTTRTDAKVWTVGPYVIGAAGSYAEMQVVRYRTELPVPDGWDLDRFMATEFVDAVLTTQREVHTARRDSDGSQLGPTLLVGVGERLYTMHADGQIGHDAGGYAAIGGGAATSLGALNVLTRKARIGEFSPDQTVRFAVQAAIDHHGACAGPIVVETNEGAS